jgi:tetratricopeptide (TPR) repeat protein
MPLPDIGETIRLIELGRTAEVTPGLENLARSFPASVTVHVLLARALEAEGVLDRALAEWQLAAVLMPNSPMVSEGLERCVRAAAKAATGASPGRLVFDAGMKARSEQSIALRLAGKTVAAPSTPSRRPSTVKLEAEARTSPGEEFEDLDRLIADLESARITPDPDLTSVPPPDLEDEIDDMVSETLARIYASQRQYDEAARVYELLAAQQPRRAKEFMSKASEMRSHAAEE